MFLNGLPKRLNDFFRILVRPTGEDFHQSVVSELLQFTVLCLIQTVGVNEQPQASYILYLLALEL